jgi:cell shape-determining protein MreD
MRTATLVLIGYAILLIVGAAWSALPGPLPEMHPEIAAILSAYLGLTARRSVAAAVGGSVVIGYLADLLGGTPVGMYSFVSGLVCIFAHLAQRRILVRGWGVTLGFSLFVGLTSAVLVPIVRLVNFQPHAPFGTEALRMLGAGVATAAVGPMMLRLFRRIDAAFARTHRERDAALEGIVT